jgi:hypothetical protein
VDGLLFKCICLGDQHLDMSVSLRHMYEHSDSRKVLNSRITSILGTRYVHSPIDYDAREASSVADTGNPVE